MAFIDLNIAENDLVLKENYDVTIVGAGAAGILLAVNLTKQGKKVLLIESGHFSIDEEKQKLNEVVHSKKILGAAVFGRNRVIGGTTVTWGGQSLHFSPLDFSKRDWVMNSGWPISYETVEPFYNDANAFMKIDRLNYDSDIFDKIKMKEKNIDPSIFDFHVAKWANEPNFKNLYSDFLEKNFTVLYNAHLYKINRSVAGNVANIEVKNFNQRSTILNINKLIIASGGIETNRIMLLNDLGNHSGWLGKCFMDHPCVEVGEVITDKAYKLQRTFNTHIWQGRKYSLRLTLSEKFQVQNKVLNCSAGVMFRPKESEFDPYSELQIFRKEFKLKSLIKLSRSSGTLIKSAWALLSKHFFYKVNAEAKLVLMLEQEPNKESYIALSNELDQFGQPKAKIAWEITYKSWETVLAASKALEKEIPRLNYGKVKLHDTITATNKNWSDSLTDVNHHMGGCRMSETAEGGVVDKNLQVWNVPNMFICSSAVYPTSSHSNPTLTLLALGLRLTDFICKS